MKAGKNTVCYLTVIILVCVLSLFASADGNTKISVQVSDIDYNERVSVFFDVSQNEGFAAFAIELKYDTSCLLLDKVSSVMPGNISYSEDFKGRGNLRMVYLSQNDYIGNGRILKLDCTLVSRARQPLSIAPFGFCDVSFVKSDASVLNVDFCTAELDTNAKRLLGYKGDVDGNGVLSSADASDILRYLVELTDFDQRQILLADNNGDGTLTSYDATLVLRYLVDLEIEYELFLKLYG